MECQRMSKFWLIAGLRRIKKCDWQNKQSRPRRTVVTPNRPPKNKWILWRWWGSTQIGWYRLTLTSRPSTMFCAVCLQKGQMLWRSCTIVCNHPNSVCRISTFKISGRHTENLGFNDTCVALDWKQTGFMKCTVCETDYRFTSQERVIKHIVSSRHHQSCKAKSQARGTTKSQQLLQDVTASALGKHIAKFLMTSW